MTDAPAPRPLSFLERHSEVIVVALLGLVSVATAYTSFQSALYGGQSSDLIAEAGAAQTQAESLYLEGNQQYVQDNQIVLQLAELKLDAQSEDPIVATDSQDKYDELYFIGVSDELDAAIKAAEALDESDSEFYHSPLDDEDYLDSLFSGYDDEAAKAEELTKKGAALGDRGDLLGFSTALMAITLFLLGVGAVVKRERTRLVLVAIGMVIFTATAALTATVPFTWIGA
jgi:hypothetical protein